MIITELPTGFRDYDFDSVEVSGLSYDDAQRLAALPQLPSFNDLKNIYERCIVSPIPITELYLADFIYLVLVIGFLSHRSAGFTWSSVCTEFVPNPRLTELSNQLSEIDDSDSDLYQDTLSEIKEIGTCAPTVECNTPISLDLTIDNIVFSECTSTMSDMLDLSIGSSRVRMPYLSDAIFRESNTSSSDYLKRLLVDIPELEVSIPVFDGVDIEHALASLDITVEPLYTKCSSCGAPHRVTLDIYTAIKDYL